MKILVLGGGGFIGSHLVDQLLTEPSYNVCAYDLYADKLVENLGQDRLTFLRGDIRKEQSRIERLVSQCDLVIDLIAHANPSLYVSHPIEVVKLNFDENLKVAEHCIKYRKRLIQFSTCEVYGKTVVPLVGDKLADPDNPSYATFHEDEAAMILGPVSKHRWIYSCAKQLLERLLHAYGLRGELDYTIVRPFNFIGPRIDYLPSEQDGNPRVFSHFLYALKTGSPMTLVNGGEQKRSYTLIDDAIDCILRIVRNPGGKCSKQIFNVGNPHNELSIRELALRMRDIYQQLWWDEEKALPELVEVSGDEFYGEGYDDSDRRIPDVSKAQSLLGWEPKYDVDQTLIRSMAYWLDEMEEDSESSSTSTEQLPKRQKSVHYA